MSVYTTIESDELEDFLTNYSVGKLADHSGISDGIENTNYFVDTQNEDGKRYVLTIFEHHTFEEMQYYLNLMHHLADHQVPSANPVADNEGHYLRRSKTNPPHWSSVLPEAAFVIQPFHTVSKLVSRWARRMLRSQF